MKIAPVTLILAAGLICLAADDKAAKKTTAAPAGMPMAKPAPEMKDLRDLVGTWNTDEKFEASQFMPAGTATGVNIVRLGPGGFSVLMEVRSKGTLGPFSGHGVMSWDPNEKAYKFAWTDSMTPGIMIETGRKEGDTLVFKGEVSMMGKKYCLLYTSPSPRDS